MARKTDRTNDSLTVMIPINPPVGDTPPTETIVARVRANAAAHPDRMALVCGDEKLTWGAFDTGINRVANLLLDQGLQKGDNVAILSPNSIPYATLFMGILRAGGCVTPLSSMASPEALQKMIADCEAKAIFVAEAYRDLLDGFLGDMELHRFALDFVATGYDSYEAALAGAGTSDPMVPIDMKDPFNLIYSSGTTGTPKGIVHDHLMRAAQMDRVTPNGYDAEARTLLSTPLYSNTTIVAFVPTLFGGSTVYLMPKFDARRYLEIVQREQITHTMLVPVQYKRIMDVPDFDSFDLSSMRMKFSTSAPLRADVKRDVLARFPGKLIEYYGLTEGGGVTVLVADEHPDKLHTVGKAAPGNEIRLIDGQGNEVAPGQVGEICGRGPTMMAGYFGRDDLTADYIWRDAQGHVYFRSGDMGHLDEDGFLTLSDRKKDMIISGGLNIYANDLELVLLDDPDVTDAAVIGARHEKWDERPVLVAVRAEGQDPSEEEVLSVFDGKIAKWQVPDKVVFTDVLPRNATGKVLKRNLREEFGEVLIG